MARRLGIDAQGLQHPGMHVVRADDDRQLDHLALAVMAAQAVECCVLHIDVSRHGIDVSEQGAVLAGEKSGRVPIRKRI